MTEKMSHERMAPPIDIKRIEGDLNKVARAEYPALVKKTGGKNLAPRRLALRNNTPYPYKLSERSQLLPSDGRETFGGVIHKSKESGMREIHSAIRDATEEHSWIFIPSQELWIDDTMGAEGMSVNGDQYLPTFLSYMYPDVEMVHTHPDKIFEGMYRDMDPRVSERYLMEAAIPSGNDFLRYTMLDSRSNQSSRFSSSVVSHYGVTSFGYNDMGEKTAGDRITQTRGLRTSFDSNPVRDPIEEVKRLLALTESKGIVGIIHKGNDEEIFPIFDISFSPATS